MLTKAALRALASSALPLSAMMWTAAPASASPTTDVFLADVRLQVDVLAASSRDAADKVQSEALKRFAADELRHQSGVLAGLDAWWARENTTTPSEVAALPLATGRSVAIDPPADAEAADAGTYAPPPGIGVLMTGASASLAKLSSLDGAAFDDSYRATQLDTLKTLEGLYDAYSHTGDNAALRDMASKEVAEILAEITALGRI